MTFVGVDDAAFIVVVVLAPTRANGGLAVAGAVEDEGSAVVVLEVPEPLVREVEPSPFGKFAPASDERGGGHLSPSLLVDTAPAEHSVN